MQLEIRYTGICRNSHPHLSRGHSLGEFSEDRDSSSHSVPCPEPWPYCDMPFGYGLLSHSGDTWQSEFAVFGKVTGAITVITGRRCPSTNNHDTGTCMFGALLLSRLQLLDISVGNLGARHRSKALWNVNFGSARGAFAGGCPGCRTPVGHATRRQVVPRSRSVTDGGGE